MDQQPEVLSLDFLRLAAMRTTPNSEQQYIKEHQVKEFSDGLIFEPWNQFYQLTLAGSLPRKIVTGKTPLADFPWKIQYPK